MTYAPTVMVVEDEPGMRATLAAILEEEGYRVVACQDGAQALRCVAEAPVDIILSDLKLPDISGPEIVRTLKAVSPDAPIILMTGYPTLETAIEAVNQGAFAYHLKPLDMDTVIDSVRDALNQRGSRPQERTILVVDDEEGLRVTLTAILQEEGYRVIPCQSGGEALRYISEKGPTDVVIADLKLPDISGLEILTCLKGTRPDAVFILMTGNATVETAIEAVNQGAFAYHVKPLDIDALINSVRHGLGQQRLLVENRNLLKRLQQFNKDLKQARDMALGASRAKSAFLATMSHEIRTPMNVILGMAEVLAETPLNSEQQEYVRVARTAGETLIGLINDVLDISRVEAGGLTLEKVGFDLGELVEKIAQVMATLAHGKGLKLGCHISPSVPTTLVGDPLRLRQVITNLVGNAVKFTDQGGVALHVENYPGSDEAGFLLFRVSDTGIGIPQGKLDVIFDDFTQGDSSMTRRYGGSGLGLAISRRLVELMGGRIWVESEVGRGSTFYFTARFGVHSAVIPPAAPRSPAPQDSRPIRILLVEDSKDNRFLVQAYLKSTPYQVDLAENGEVGVKKFTTGKYDLVLMDLQMPVMDGYTATKAIRKWESEQAVEATPIIALTASAFVEAVQRSLEAGCTDHINKPVKKALLLETIYKYTGNGIESPTPTAGRNDTVAEVPTDQPAFNLDAALGLLEGDVGLLKEIAALFFEVAPGLLSEIREAITQRDPGTLERAAHTLKGSVNNFGALNASNVALRLEEMGRCGDFTNAEAASVELEKEIACLKDALTTLREEVPA